MAHATVDIPRGAWTLLTNADTAAVTVMNLDVDDFLFVQGTSGVSVPPVDTDFSGAIYLQPGEGLMNVNPAELFPGVTGCNRLWGLFRTGGGRVSVSHA